MVCAAVDEQEVWVVQIAWMACGVTVWVLVSMAVSAIVGQIVSDADDRARAESAQPVVVPTGWRDELVDH